MLGRGKRSLKGGGELVRKRGMQRRGIGVNWRRSASTTFWRVAMLFLWWRRGGWTRPVRALRRVRVSLVPVGSRAEAELVGGVIGRRGNDAVRGLFAGGVEELRSARGARG